MIDVFLYDILFIIVSIHAPFTRFIPQMVGIVEDNLLKTVVIHVGYLCGVLYGSCISTSFIAVRVDPVSLN